MKRTLFQILAVAAVGAMCSCSDFLDPYPSAIRSEEYILTNPTTMQGLIGKCYDYMAQNYNDNEGAYLDCATDNAVRTSTTDAPWISVEANSKYYARIKVLKTVVGAIEDYLKTHK